jgi:flagellar P-ring protein precursor FlgI
MKKTLASLLVFAAWPMAAATTTSTSSVRLKELVTLEGVRDNQLMGYGLVVGLAGTGDRRQTIFSAQSLANLLERMGLTVDPTSIQVKNTASVMVTAILPPFAQPGSRIDVTIAAMGDAPSLQGGVLLMTGLKGPDGQVYAVAQGASVLGGYSAGQGAASASQNHPTVSRIPDGAIVERGSPSVNLGNQIHLQLAHADFTTAARVAEVLNKHFGEIAHADNAALISVVLPAEFARRSTEFVAEMEALTIEPDVEAVIVVNERTGTIVMGKNVKIAPVAIMQGNLSVQIQTTFDVSQPAPLSAGTTTVTPKTNVAVKQEPARNLMLKEGATVEELVKRGGFGCGVEGDLENFRSPQRHGENVRLGFVGGLGFAYSSGDEITEVGESTEDESVHRRDAETLRKKK